MQGFRRLAVIAAVILVAACSQEEILPGERLELDATMDLPVAEATAPIPLTFTPPPVEQVTEWTHRAGNAQHRLSNPALSSRPALIWSARIGDGDGRKHRIAAAPVVSGGRIFTMDSQASVAATSTAGETLWQTDLTPASERRGHASGGGLAVAGGRVFATSGYGMLAALDAESGEVLWQQQLGAGISSAPTVAGGTVYAVAADSRAWALEVETGRIVWQVAGTPSQSGLVGGGAPAVTDRLILLPFRSSEVIGVLPLSGIRIWTAPVSAPRSGMVYAEFTDITGDPVVDGGRVYVGSPAGGFFALDAASGERLWTADDGALNPAWVAGGAIFVITDLNELVRLDAATGARVWATPLPNFTRSKVKRRDAIYDHYGPVLAGGRLFVASSDNLLRIFDPATGGLVGTVDLPGGAATLPAVVDGILYVVSSRGNLLAFR